jgi:hypothetical protein
VIRGSWVSLAARVDMWCSLGLRLRDRGCKCRNFERRILCLRPQNLSVCLLLYNVLVHVDLMQFCTRGNPIEFVDE